MNKASKLEGFRSGLLAEGLVPGECGISDILVLSPAAIHRIAYAGMVSEVRDNVTSIANLINSSPVTASASAMMEFLLKSGPPDDLDESFEFAKSFITNVMPEVVRTNDLSAIRFQLFFDTTYEGDPNAARALQVLRILDLTHPGHLYTPGSKMAHMIEKLDPPSIFAWYSRHVTSPFHIDDGKARPRRISSGFVYLAPDAVTPDLSEKEMRGAIKELLEEAATSRRGSIPNAAFVEIDIPPLVCLCFAEISPNLVVMEGLDPDGRSLPITYQPGLGRFHGPNTGAGADGKIESFQKYVVLVALLGAAAIRDFWVIEDRDRILGPARVSRPRGMRANTSRVIYLPRVRYSGASLNKGVS